MPRCDVMWVQETGAHALPGQLLHIQQCCGLLPLFCSLCFLGKLSTSPAHILSVDVTLTQTPRPRRALVPGAVHALSFWLQQQHLPRQACRCEAELLHQRVLGQLLIFLHTPCPLPAAALCRAPLGSAPSSRGWGC